MYKQPTDDNVITSMFCSGLIVKYWYENGMHCVLLELGSESSHFLHLC